MQPALCLLMASMFMGGVSSALADAGEGPIRIENVLKSCIQLNDVTVAQQGELAALSISVQIDQPIGACGCKSALGSYTVFSDEGGYRRYLLNGNLSLMPSDSGSRVVPLAADRELMTGKPLIVMFSCAAPD